VTGRAVARVHLAREDVAEELVEEGKVRRDRKGHTERREPLRLEGC
jgi:hypothetical protein